MAVDPFRVVRDFESALCEYTGASFAVTTTSCTMALLLAVAWHLREPRIRKAHAGDFGRSQFVDIDHVLDTRSQRIEIPRHTYVSVPMSIIHAGGRPTFRDEDWRGAYRLMPLPVHDCARRFTGGMYLGDVAPCYDFSGHMQCVSFHHSKILGDSQGGAILHDDPEADKWLRRARFDGRTEGVDPKDDEIMLGYHCYLSPDVAARLLWRLSKLPAHNEDLENDQYPDLSQMEIFK